MRLLAVLACFAAILTTACAQAKHPPDIWIPQLPARQERSSAPSDNIPDFYPSVFVIDAPTYRGTVKEIVPLSGGAIQMQLESYKGTDFGYPLIFMHTDKETKTDFELSRLVEGDYLQLFYKDRTNGMPPIVLAASRFPDPENIIYNGEVASHTPGRLELCCLESGNIVVFRYDNSTHFHLDDYPPRPGTIVNILHRGTLDSSNPPVGFAFEARPYKDYKTL